MRRSLVVIIVSVVFLSVLGGYIIYRNVNMNEKRENYSGYIVSIWLTEPGNFVLYLPLPIENGTEKLHEIVNAVQVTKGVANFEINITNYGPALKISGNSNVTLSAKSVLQPKQDFLILSLQNETVLPRDGKVQYWVFLDSHSTSKNMRIRIELITNYWDKDNVLIYSFDIDDSIKRYDWQIAEGWFQMAVP